MADLPVINSGWSPKNYLVLVVSFWECTVVKIVPPRAGTVGEYSMAFPEMQGFMRECLEPFTLFVRLGWVCQMGRFLRAFYGRFVVARINLVVLYQACGDQLRDESNCYV